ncbi:MAG: GNAT family N-acetyltransferase [Maribacter sp.]
MTNIVLLSTEETWPIRHKVMWPDHPIDFVKLPNDADGRHFGLYLETDLVSVISIFTENNEVQFRKFATLQEYQGKGFGTRLLTEIMRIVAQEKVSKIWCNARITKTDFYGKFGMRPTETRFTKAGIDYVIMERSFH